MSDTPLHKAIREQDYETFCALLPTADVNAKGNDDSTPLIDVCYQRSSDISRQMFQDLLNHPDIDVNLTDVAGVSALGVAIVRRLDLVRPLLEAGANPNNYTYIRMGGGINPTGRNYDEWRQMTPLCVAVRNHDKELVSLLLDHGAVLDIVGDLDISPLSMAARSNDIDMMRFLVERGASLETLPTNWRDYTQKPQDGCSVVLRKALKYGSVECLDFLVKSGIHIPERIYRQRGEYATPLTYVLSQPHTDYQDCMSLHARTALFLIKQNVSKTEADFHGQTPLFHAVCRHHYALCQKLITPETINKADIFGNTPLARACRRGDLNIIRLLLENGANPNAGVRYVPRSLRGMSDNPEGVEEPLIYFALRYRQENIAALLIKHGANLLWKDDKGQDISTLLRFGFSPAFKKMVLGVMKRQQQEAQLDNTFNQEDTTQAYMQKIRTEYVKNKQK